MARPLRVNIADGWYHVYARGLDRMVIFLDDGDREHMLALLGEVVQRYRIVLHAYVLMDNHYHLIVQTPDANLSRGMQWLNLSYAAWFNTRHHRKGPVYQRPFGSKPIENSAWAYELSTYVHLNPLRIRRFKLSGPEGEAVRKGLSRPPDKEQIGRRLEKLRKYRWSSYPAYAGYRRPPDWLYSAELHRRASREKKAQRQAYRSHVQALLKQGGEAHVIEKLRGGLAIGEAGFLERVKALGAKAGLNRETSGKRAIRARVEVAEVIAAVERVKGEKWSDFAGRHGDPGTAMVMWLARRCTGLTLSEIGREVGGKDYAAVHMSIKRLAARVREDRPTRKLLKHASQLLNVEMSPQ